MKQFARSTLVVLALFSVPVLASPSQKPAPATAPSNSTETITLHVGNSKAVRAPGMNRVAVGDPGIAEINFPGDNLIQVKGLAAGETTLVVWIDTEIKTYRIVVDG